MQAQAPLAPRPEVHPLLAGLAATISTPDEAYPLAKFIDELVPAALREDPHLSLDLSLWLNRMKEARLRSDHGNLRIYEDQVLHMYPFAMNALWRFLAERDGGIVPARLETPVARAATASARSTGRAPTKVGALVTTPADTMSVPTGEMKRTVLSAAPNVTQLAQASSVMAAPFVPSGVSGVWTPRLPLQLAPDGRRLPHVLPQPPRVPLAIANGMSAIRLCAVIKSTFSSGPLPPDLRVFMGLMHDLLGQDVAREHGHGDPDLYATLERQILDMYPTVLARTQAEAESRAQAIRDETVRYGAALATQLGGKVAEAAARVFEELGPALTIGKASGGASSSPSTRSATITTPAALPPPTEEMNCAVLSAAPNIMRLAQTSSGMAAVVFEFVRREKLFTQAGYENMAEYAAAELNVMGETYRKYAQAGRAAWEHYPAGAWETIEYVCGAANGKHPLLPPGVGVGHSVPGTRVPPNTFPTVPPVSLLKELPRALRRTDPSEHPEIIAAVAAGTVTYEALHQKGRVAKSEHRVAPVSDDLLGNDVDDGDELDVTESRGRPSIFNDVPELSGALRHARRSNELLETLVRIWRNDGGPDVDPIVPRVRALAGQLRSVASELENHILPEKVCTACGGKGCRACARMGWFPRVPLRKGPKKAAPRTRAKTLRHENGSKKKTSRRTGR